LLSAWPGGRILDGAAQPKIYLSSLDAGVGKTVTLCQTIDYLRQRGENFGGMVLALGRLDQIEGAIRELRLHPDEFACFTSRWATTSFGEKFVDLGAWGWRMCSTPRSCSPLTP
jgi:hypothetical protein